MVTVTIQHLSDAIVIGIVVVLNTVIGLVPEYRAENAMQALIQMSTPKARVRRENHEANIMNSGALHFRLWAQINYHKNVMEILFLCIFMLCLFYSFLCKMKRVYCLGRKDREEFLVFCG